MLKPFLDKLLRRSRTAPTDEDDLGILPPIPLPADLAGSEHLLVVGAHPAQASVLPADVDRDAIRSTCATRMLELDWERALSQDEARARREAIVANRNNPELKVLLLENMTHEPEELLAFAVESGDEDAAVLVFQGVIQSTWHASTSEGWEDRWQDALDAGLAPRAAFLAMGQAWIDHALVNSMTEAVVRSAADSGMREDHIDFPAFWKAAKQAVAMHKLIEAVVREKFRAAGRG